MRIKHIAFIFLLSFAVLCTGCGTNKNAEINNTETNDMESQNSETGQTEKDTSIWIEYNPEDFITDADKEPVVMGTKETGRLTLRYDYEITDLSKFFKTEVYQMGTGPKIGAAITISKDTPDHILNKNYNKDGYTPSEIKTLVDNEEYLGKQYYAADKSNGSYYCTTCLLDKKTNKTTVISIASLTFLTEEEFKVETETILSTHSSGVLKIDKERSYENE